jgi:hypothetical protein
VSLSCLAGDDSCGFEGVFVGSGVSDLGRGRSGLRRINEWAVMAGDDRAGCARGLVSEMGETESSLSAGLESGM